MLIRDVREDDIERLIEIYSYYVENTAVSYEYVTPSYEEFKRRVDGITKKYNYPYLVCEMDGKVIGYV